jgi:phosphohistidine phosphatase
MPLYLVRHADAVDADEDAARPLSERGREQMRRLTQLLKANRSLELTEIWHSPLVRARQTARLLAEGLGSKAPLVEIPAIQPDENPRAILMRIATAKGSVAVVGHDPHLSASRRDASSAAIHRTFHLFFARGARSPCRWNAWTSAWQGEWVVLWHASPELYGM